MTGGRTVCCSRSGFGAFDSGFQLCSLALHKHLTNCVLNPDLCRTFWGVAIAWITEDRYFLAAKHEVMTKRWGLEVQVQGPGALFVISAVHISFTLQQTIPPPPPHTWYLLDRALMDHIPLKNPTHLTGNGNQAANSTSLSSVLTTLTNRCLLLLLLGELAYCEKLLLPSSFLSVPPPSCRMELGSHWTGFQEIWYFSIFWKYVKNIQA